MYTCKHILLVEDDEDDQAFFLEAIHNKDTAMAVTIAPNGQEALTLLETLPEPPHLIFLDINMPLVNGLECLGRIRQQDRFRRIPVFILSTSGDPISVSIAKKLEADGYLTKPYLRDGLEAQLEQVLGLDFSLPRDERPTPFLQLIARSCS